MPTITIEVEIEVDVEFSCYKAIRGYRNSFGVPEELDEDAHNEINSITYNGKALELSANDMKIVEQAVDEYDPEDWDPG